MEGLLFALPHRAHGINWGDSMKLQHYFSRSSIGTCGKADESQDFAVDVKGRKGRVAGGGPGLLGGDGSVTVPKLEEPGLGLGLGLSLGLGFVGGHSNGTDGCVHR